MGNERGNQGYRKGHRFNAQLSIYKKAREKKQTCRLSLNFFNCLQFLTAAICLTSYWSCVKIYIFYMSSPTEFLQQNVFELFVSFIFFLYIKLCVERLCVITSLSSVAKGKLKKNS